MLDLHSLIQIIKISQLNCTFPKINFFNTTYLLSINSEEKNLFLGPIPTGFYACKKNSFVANNNLWNHWIIAIAYEVN